MSGLLRFSLPTMLAFGCLCSTIIDAKTVAEVITALSEKPNLSYMPTNPWSDGPLKVQVGFRFQKILNLDISTGSVTFTTWIRQRWLDKRLYFNGSAEFGQGWDPSSDSIPMPRDVAWKPDLYLASAAHAGEEETTSPKDIYLWDEQHAKSQSPPWNMHWVEPVTLTGRCKVDLKMFPFDTQRCTLDFESWMYSNRMINLIVSANMSSQGDFRDTTNEYKFAVSAATRSQTVYAVTKRSYASVTLTLTFQRYPHYYIINAIMPMLIMEVLSGLMLWIPVDAGERLSYGITGLLTTFAITLFMAERRPAIKEETWLDRFQSECYLVCFLPVFYSILILWWTTERSNLIESKGLRHGENEEDTGPKPKLLLLRLLSSDIVTPTQVDMVIRHASPIGMIITLSYQYSQIPEGVVVDGMADFYMQSAQWATIVILMLASGIMVIRGLAGKNLSRAEVDAIVGSAKVWVVSTWKQPTQASVTVPV